MQELRGEVVPELRQGLLQLALVDRPRAVAVEVPEDVLPVLDVLPEASELGVVLVEGQQGRGYSGAYFVEADSPTPVGVLVCR